MTPEDIAAASLILTTSKIRKWLDSGVNADEGEPWRAIADRWSTPPEVTELLVYLAERLGYSHHTNTTLRELLFSADSVQQRRDAEWLRDLVAIQPPGSI